MIPTLEKGSASDLPLPTTSTGRRPPFPLPLLHRKAAVPSHLAPQAGRRSLSPCATAVTRSGGMPRMSWPTACGTRDTAARQPPAPRAARVPWPPRQTRRTPGP
eukprot:355289-Chlamydomonas_euryale.AAC.6